MYLKDGGPGDERPSSQPSLPNRPKLSIGGGRKNFPSQQRLRRREEFRRVLERGKKRYSQHFVVVVEEKTEGPSRLGITVSRKVGGAVTRNRVKRLIREFYRNHQGELAVLGDVSIIAKKNASEVSYGQVCAELDFLLAK